MSEYKFEDYDYKETKEDVLFEYFVYTLFMCLSIFVLLNLVKFNEKPVEIVYIDSGKVIPVLDEVEVEFQPSTLSTSR